MGVGVLICAVYPLLLSGASPGRDLPATYGGEDPLLQSAILQQSLHHPPLRLDSWHAPFHWPGRFALAYMDPLLGQAILVGWIPGVRGEPAWAYNLVMMITLASSFLVTAHLARSMGLPRGAAWLAGLTYCVSPYAVAHLHHLNQIPPPWLPLSLTGWLLVARGRTRGALLVAFALLFQLVSGLYYTAVMVMTLGLVGVCAAPRERRAWIAILTVAVGAGLAMWVWSIPYRAAAGAVEGFGRSGHDVGPFAARPFDLLHGPRAHLLPWPPFVPGRPVIYPGVGWSLLALGAVLEGARRWRVGARLPDRLLLGLVLAGLVGLVLSFGRTVPVPGRDTELTLPWAWLQDHVWPLRALRSPSRFFLPATLALALLGSAGVVDLLRWSRARRRGAGWLVVGGIALALLDLVPGPTGRVRAALDASERALIERLGTADPPSPWLAFPQPCRERDETQLDARCMLWAVLSGQPVAGGSTGFVPRPVAELRQRCCAGPAPACLEHLARLGITRVVIPAAAPPLPAARATLRYRDERWRLYRLKPGVGAD